LQYLGAATGSLTETFNLGVNETESGLMAIIYSIDALNIPAGEGTIVSLTFEADTPQDRDCLSAPFNVIVGDAEGNNISEEFIVLNDGITYVDSSVDECFIATAAFGSKLHPAVALLRHFRDTRLLTNRPGRTFVHYYYTVSPLLAARIADSPFLKGLVCIALLPVIAVAFLFLQAWWWQSALLLTLILMLVLWQRKRRRKSCC